MMLSTTNETNFLKKREDLGNKTENGKKCFFSSGWGFKIWHNIQPEINEVSKL